MHQHSQTSHRLFWGKASLGVNLVPWTKIRVYCLRTQRIASTSAVTGSLGLHGSFWFCQIDSIWAERSCKNWTPQGEGKAAIPVQLSRADPKVHPETQDFLGSLQSLNKGPISFTAAPKKEFFVFFRTGLAPMHWEISSLTWHELQQAWNSHWAAPRNWWDTGFLSQAPGVKCTDFKSHFCHTQFLLSPTMFPWPCCPAEQNQLHYG